MSKAELHTLVILVTCLSDMNIINLSMTMTCERLFVVYSLFYEQITLNVVSAFFQIINTTKEIEKRW